MEIDCETCIFKDKNRILVVMAHPDDNEIICGGLMARLIADGKKVRLVVTTNGDKRMGDRADVTVKEFGKIRVEEQVKAGMALGIPKEEIFNLGVSDGELEASIENIRKIVFHIREFKPDVVITHCPDEIINSFSKETRWVNHRDHRNTGIITVDAVYPYSRDLGFFPEHFKKGLESHTVECLLFSDSYMHPERVYFNVSGFIDKKRKALECCGSVVSEDHLEGYIEELKYGEGYFEPLRLVKIS